MVESEKMAGGFQPTLFRLNEEQSIEEQLLLNLLEDLKNPDNVLQGFSLPPYRLRALELGLRNPHFTSSNIVTILAFEGLGKFSESDVRVWKLRAKRFQNKQLTSA